MIFVNSDILWLWLNECVKLNRSKQLKLFRAFGSIENIYGAKLSEYTEFEFLTSDDLGLLSKKNAHDTEARYNNMKAHGVRIIAIDSPYYPDLLKEISDPPCVLYCRGKLINLNERLCIAVVGTRKPTPYGRITAFNLSKAMASRGVIIVSGMAMGIDSKAHEGALSANAPTVAVIGCGVDIVYPRSNAGLMKSIEKTGMIISEYPLGEAPARYHFPERNRIISGMCQGSLIVEADIKSGSLITAKSAYEQGRDVFAVPGNINSIYSKGTNYLLKDGARLVTCDEDVLSYYSYDYADRIAAGSFDAEPVCTENIQLPEDTQDRSLEDILLKIVGDSPVHTDTICSLSRLDAGSVNSALLLMELSGKVVKLPGGFYQKR